MAVSILASPGDSRSALLPALALTPMTHSMHKLLILLSLGLLWLPLGSASARGAAPAPSPLQDKHANPLDKGITGFFMVVAEDGNKIRVAEFLPHGDPKTPLILLFHDGSKNRAEYRYIAPRLNRMGFNCMAPDLRAGKNNLGHKNATLAYAKRAKLDQSVLAARQDMQALIVYARESHPEAPILLLGCSYSASHALRLAGEMHGFVDGVVAFSPAEIFEGFGKSKNWIGEGMPNVHCPVLITSDGIEKEEWIGIYNALPEGRKHMFAPKGSAHGVLALADKNPESEATWDALTSFMERYFPSPSSAASQASEPAPSPPEPEDDASDMHVSLERMLVLGASVSMGFFLPAGLDDLLEASCNAKHEKVRAKAEGSFAWDSVKVATKQIEFAEELDPTLLVAIDFLFWLGYGSINAAGEILSSEAERLELLDAGLALLDRLDCPMLLGDFPNMSHASGEGFMIGAQQLPSRETLAQLNQRLGEWAEQRGGVIVLPLKDWQTQMNSNQAFRMGNYRWPAGSELRVLQRDRLHPTFEGLAALSHCISLELVRRGWSSREDWNLDLASVLAEFERELKDIETLEPLASRD